MAVAAKEALELMVTSLGHDVAVGVEESGHWVFFALRLMLLEAGVVTEPLIAVLALDLQATVSTQLPVLWRNAKFQDVGKVWRALLLLLR